MLTFFDGRCRWAPSLDILRMLGIPRNMHKRVEAIGPFPLSEHSVGVAMEVEERCLFYFLLVIFLQILCHDLVFVGIMLGTEPVAAGVER